MRADKPIDALAIVAMLVLCLSWAFQQIAVKWALPEMGVLSQGAWRSALATCLVGAYMASRWFAASWKPGVTMPALSFA